MSPGLHMKLKMINYTLYKVQSWVALLRTTIWAHGLSQPSPHSTPQNRKTPQGASFFSSWKKKGCKHIWNRRHAKSRLHTSRYLHNSDTKQTTTSLKTNYDATFRFFVFDLLSFHNSNKRAALLICTPTQLSTPYVTLYSTMQQYWEFRNVETCICSTNCTSPFLHKTEQKTTENMKHSLN